MADNINITNEELNEALAGAEELDNLTTEESFNKLMSTLEEGRMAFEESRKAEEERNKVANQPKVGDYVKFSDPSANIIFGVEANENLKIISIDNTANVATIVKEGEETTPLHVHLDFLEKTEYVASNDNVEIDDENSNDFNFSSIAEMPISETNNNFNFNRENNEQATTVSESLPLEYNEYKPETELQNEESSVSPVEPLVAPLEEIAAIEPTVGSKNEKDESSIDDKKEEKEIIAEEKGSKPIRWSATFIDKIRAKREARKEERITNKFDKYQNKKIDETEKADMEVIKKAKKENETEKANGKLVKFGHSLKLKSAKLFKTAGEKITSQINVTTENIKASKAKRQEKAEAKKKAKAELKKQKNVETKNAEKKEVENSQEKETKTKENEKEPIELSDTVLSVTNCNDPYEVFLQLSEEEKRFVINDLVKALGFLQQQVKLAETKLKEAEMKLEEASKVVSAQNQKIEDLSKSTDMDNKTQQAENEEENLFEKIISEREEKENKESQEDKSNDETKENEVAEETKSDDDDKENTDVPNEQIESNNEVSNKAVVEPEKVRSGIDWDDPIVKQELEANKKSADRAKEIEDAKKKPSKEELKQALKEGKLSVKVKEEVPTFNEEELRNDEMNRYSYDREKQAEVEAFWQNQAAYIDNPEYIEAARERATENIEMQKLRNQEYYDFIELERKNREKLINETNLEAKKNRVKANLILDNFNPEQIAQMDDMLQEESKGRTR